MAKSGSIPRLTFPVATACYRPRGNRSNTSENRSHRATQAPGTNGLCLSSTLRPFAADQGTDEARYPETERTSCLPVIGRPPAARHSKPKTRGRRVSGISPAREAFRKGSRQTVAHLLLYSVKQSHSRSARRKVSLDLFIPAGAIQIDDPGSQRDLLFGRQFYDGVLNFGEVHRTILPQSPATRTLLWIGLTGE